MVQFHRIHQFLEDLFPGMVLGEHWINF